jgi:hypothetical protein
VVSDEAEKPASWREFSDANPHDKRYFERCVREGRAKVGESSRGGDHPADRRARPGKRCKDSEEY